jgi:hypothetical protein
MTVTEIRAQGSTAPLATREDALKFMAVGRTSADLLANAASPSTVAAVAAQAGATLRHIRNVMLALSAAVGELEAEGITPPDCWRILGWSPEFVEELLGLSPDGAR